MVGALAAIAEGFLRIANANMAQAIRSISLAKGYDPRAYVLIAFGSAGPQHACAVAAELGISRVTLFRLMRDYKLQVKKGDLGLICVQG